MSDGQVSRREFLEASSVGYASLALGMAGATALGRRKSDEVVLGIIGTGGRGRFLLDRIPEQGVRIGAVCDLRQDQIDKAMKIVGAHKPKTYKDFHNMLDKEKMDGVIVATEVGNHAKVAIPVLEAGFNLFCEKPVESNVEKLDAFVAAARKAKGICQLGLQRRYKPGYVEAIKKIQDGAVGKIRFLQGHWKWLWKLGGGWIIDVEVSGGELVEQAVHHMDVMSWIMKGAKPERVISMGGVMRPNPKKSVVEDHSSTTFEFPGGVQFQYTHLFHVGTKQFCGELLRVYGETGGAEINKLDYFKPGSWKLYDKDANETEMSQGTCDHSQGTKNELAAFAERCCGGEGMPASNIETARIATLMAMMGRMAMFNMATKKWDERVIEWKDLGSTTD